MEIVVSQQQATVPAHTLWSQVTVFQISGEIDADSRGQLEAAGQEAIGSGTRYLVLDLADVTDISSAGLRAIQSIFTMLYDYTSPAENEAMRKGVRDGSTKSARLKLANVSPQVLRVLRTAGFDMFLEIHRNLPEALASF